MVSSRAMVEITTSSQAGDEERKEPCGRTRRGRPLLRRRRRASVAPTHRSTGRRRCGACGRRRGGRPAATPAGPAAASCRLPPPAAPWPRSLRALLTLRAPPRSPSPPLLMFSLVAGTPLDLGSVRSQALLVFCCCA